MTLLFAVKEKEAFPLRKRTFSELFIIAEWKWT